MGYHKDETGSSLHTPFRWIFTDATERLAESVGATDVNKTAWQKSDDTIWVLEDDSPVTWSRLCYDPLASAISVATVEAITSVTTPLVLSGAIRGSSLSNWGVYIGSAELDDEEEMSVIDAFPDMPGTYIVMGFVKVVDDPSGTYILGEVGYVVGEALSIVTDISSIISTTDTDNKLCFFEDGSQLKVKNRIGVSVNLKLVGFIRST
jgi:hypothetical protein